MRGGERLRRQPPPGDETARPSSKDGFCRQSVWERGIATGEPGAKDGALGASCEGTSVTPRYSSGDQEKSESAEAAWTRSKKLAGLTATAAMTRMKRTLRLISVS